jgi:hypothetical protein
MDHIIHLAIENEIDIFPGCGPDVFSPALARASSVDPQLAAYYLGRFAEDYANPIDISPEERRAKELVWILPYQILMGYREPFVNAVARVMAFGPVELQERLSPEGLHEALSARRSQLEMYKFMRGQGFSLVHCPAIRTKSKTDQALAPGAPFPPIPDPCDILGSGKINYSAQNLPGEFDHERPRDGRSRLLPVHQTRWERWVTTYPGEWTPWCFARKCGHPPLQ